MAKILIKYIINYVRKDFIILDFYKKLSEEYIGVTDGKTLNLQAIDGCFVQNVYVYGEHLYKHNPAFYNKTGCTVKHSFS